MLPGEHSRNNTFRDSVFKKMPSPSHQVYTLWAGVQQSRARAQAMDHTPPAQPTVGCLLHLLPGVTAVLTEDFAPWGPQATDHTPPSHPTLGCLLQLLPGVTASPLLSRCLCAMWSWVFPSLYFPGDSRSQPADVAGRLPEGVANPTLGLPLFLFPWGFRVTACLVMLLAGFLRVWPIQLYFLLLICAASGSWVAVFHRSSSYLLWPPDIEVLALMECCLSCSPRFRSTEVY